MIRIGLQDLKLKDFTEVVLNNESISIDEKALKKTGESYRFLREFSKDKLIYGINTGLGPMAQYRINNKDRIKLQYNAVRSHAAGSGDALPEVYARAAMLARLKTLAKGYSGVHPGTLTVLEDFINYGIVPYIPVHGGVGASGDLIQLAHLALNLIGEGDVFYMGKKVSAAELLRDLKINPLEIKLREGLSLINGTSVMTGIGLVNLVYARRVMNWSALASCLMNEIVQSYDDHLSEELNGVKNHRGQNEVARIMRDILDGSHLIRRRSEHLYEKKINGSFLKEKVQEYYSIRCVPQIIGPVFDTLSMSEKILLDELNSVSDNPIVDIEHQNVFHGGNFHGDYVAIEMDKMKVAITKLTMLMERQLNFLLNEKLNQVLPPFVNLGKLGLNFGMQGMQFTATSTTAENQALANSVYVHSISCNNDNQDIVSMGTNASLMAMKVIDNACEVMAIEMIALLQSVDFLKIEKKLSKTTREYYIKLRHLVPAFVDDSPKYREISDIKDFIKNNNPVNN